MPCPLQAHRMLILSLDIIGQMVDLYKKQGKYYKVNAEILLLDFRMNVGLGCPNTLNISGTIEK